MAMHVPWSRRGRSRGAVALGLCALCAGIAAGCTEGTTVPAGGAPGIPGVAIEADPPQPRHRDGLLQDRQLQDVVELQLRRDGPALVEFLDSESAPVRARAAFALGSAQWPGAAARLEGLLRDSDAGVRGDAAFALGQLPSANPGPALLRALTEEAEPRVRVRLIEAIGKVGDTDSLQGLLGLSIDPVPGPADESARTLALARALVRGVDVSGGVEALADRLRHEDAATREAAAWYFGRSTEPSVWAEQLGEIRSALDAAERTDPAAMHLLLALARYRSADDTERLLRGLGSSADWRSRVNAARGFGHVAWIERDGVREGLFRALEDPVEQVAITAARSLTQGLWVPPHVIVQMEERLRDEPEDRWRVHVPFLRQVSQFGDPQVVVDWTRRVMDSHPLAVANGLAALSEAGVADMEPLLLQAVNHSTPELRNVGVSALAGSWEGLLLRGMDAEEIQSLLLGALAEGPGPAAVYAAPVLAHPTFSELGASEDALLEAGWNWLEAGEAHVGGALARVLVELGDARGEGLAAAADAAIVNLVPDWAYLASLGDNPRLLVETTRGDIVIRLSASEAPLTVQALARLADSGRHDGIPLHRLEPNFVIQGGDVAMSDGSGFPGFRIPSEFTTIPFGRGTLGMASLGKDTEGSQFFLTHSMQPHLDGSFTSFGWVESGFDVMDHLGVGDRVLRMRVEPDPEGSRGGE